MISTARSWSSARSITTTTGRSTPPASCSPSTWPSSRTSPRPPASRRTWSHEIQSILGWPATKEQIQHAKHLVPDDLILRITASGTPDEARAKVKEYVKHGCTCPILYPVGGDVSLLIDTFAQA